MIDPLDHLLYLKTPAPSERFGYLLSRVLRIRDFQIVGSDDEGVFISFGGAREMCEVLKWNASHYHGTSLKMIRLVSRQSPTAT